MASENSNLEALVEAQIIPRILSLQPYILIVWA